MHVYIQPEQRKQGLQGTATSQEGPTAEEKDTMSSPYIPRWY